MGTSYLHARVGFPVNVMIIFYVVFFFLILRFAITLFNFISNPKLIAVRQRQRDLISILVPVRNEETNVEALVERVKAQDYKEYELVFLDDNSTDNTLSKLRQLSSGDDRIRVIEGKDLPADWSGKNYACHQLAKVAKGRYLFFIDVGVMPQRGFFNHAVFRMKMNGLGLLSLFPDQRLHSLAEYLIIPLMHWLLLTLLPIRLVRLSSSTFFSAASGQCMVFDAALYKEHQWHAQVKNEMSEDLYLMKLVKAYRYKAETLLANGFLVYSLRRSMADTLQTAVRGLLTAFRGNIAAILCFVLLSVLGPVFIYVYLDIRLLSFAIGLMILIRLMVSLQSRESALLNIILHPLQMLGLVVIVLGAMFNAIRHSLIWKGRKVKAG